MSLDGTWQAIPDQYKNFEDPFGDLLDEEDASGFTVKPIFKPEASVENDPADFNIHDGLSVGIPSSFGEEIPEFRHYEGWVWFARTFDQPFVGTKERVFLRFGAVNYKSTVWLNGTELGSHEGGYTPFTFDITDELRSGENTLVVRVDNERYEDGIPNETTDWYNFDGINRSVELVTVPETYIRNYKVEVELGNGAVDVGVTVWVRGADDETAVSINFPELERAVELSSDGSNEMFTASLSLSAADVTLWSPSSPRLYTVRIEADDDSIEDHVGLRELQVDGSDILLNGEPVWLRGISLHEEAAGKGRALEIGDVETRFQRLTELGCNYAPDLARLDIYKLALENRILYRSIG